jgi:hypothetical protein
MDIYQVYGIRVPRAEIYKWAIENPQSRFHILINDFIKNLKVNEFDEYIKALESKTNISTVRDLQSNIRELRDDLHVDIGNHFCYSFSKSKIGFYRLTHDVDRSESDFIIGIKLLTIQCHNQTLLVSPINPLTKIPILLPINAETEQDLVNDFKGESLDRFSQKFQYYLIQNNCSCCD